MKVVILAGGRGTRISEESHLKPKPMIEIGSNPILWHIMKYYSHFGYNDFIICCGYKGYIIKEYFADYYLHRSDITFDFSRDNEMIVHNNVAEPWRVTIIDTGLNTQTGARIKKIQKFIGNEPFMLTYGDGVSNVDLDKLVEFHKKNGKYATMTAIQPGGRFGVLDISKGNKIERFTEKSKEDGGWVNGGFMVLEPQVFDYLDDDPNLVFERSPLENIAKDGQLMAYKHKGFWQCMDTLRDRILLEEMIEKNEAPWMVWENE
ncbi:MAG: glucose-1-phosphate cytidylyltransferase [Clostridiales bacterium]|nr:glucose-1-phosphate cytidylyltransferase [Clostridiales bacterium]